MTFPLMPFRSIFTICALVVGLAAGASTARADIRAYAETGDPEASGLELLQEEAHDLIYFTEESGGGWVKVRPLPFPGRKIPEEKGGVLVVEVLSIEGRKFAVRWDEILKVDLWEIRLERETKDRIATLDFVGAYPYLSILQRWRCWKNCDGTHRSMNRPESVKR
jgi:hypothetical protein